MPGWEAVGITISLVSLTISIGTLLMTLKTAKVLRDIYLLQTFNLDWRQSNFERNPYYKEICKVIIPIYGMSKYKRVQYDLPPSGNVFLATSYLCLIWVLNLVWVLSFQQLDIIGAVISAVVCSLISCCMCLLFHKAFLASFNTRHQDSLENLKLHGKALETFVLLLSVLVSLGTWWSLYASHSNSEELLEFSFYHFLISAALDIPLRLLVGLVVLWFRLMPNYEMVYFPLPLGVSPKDLPLYTKTPVREEDDFRQSNSLSDYPEINSPLRGTFNSGKSYPDYSRGLDNTDLLNQDRSITRVNRSPPKLNLDLLEERKDSEDTIATHQESSFREPFEEPCEFPSTPQPVDPCEFYSPSPPMNNSPIKLPAITKNNIKFTLSRVESSDSEEESFESSKSLELSKGDFEQPVYETSQDLGPFGNCSRISHSKNQDTFEPFIEENPIRTLNTEESKQSSNEVPKGIQEESFYDCPEPENPELESQGFLCLEESQEEHPSKVIKENFYKIKEDQQQDKLKAEKLEVETPQENTLKNHLLESKESSKEVFGTKELSSLERPEFSSNQTPSEGSSCKQETPSIFQNRENVNRISINKVSKFPEKPKNTINHFFGEETPCEEIPELPRKPSYKKSRNPRIGHFLKQDTIDIYQRPTEKTYSRSGSVPNKRDKSRPSTQREQSFEERGISQPPNTSLIHKKVPFAEDKPQKPPLEANIKRGNRALLKYVGEMITHKEEKKPRPKPKSRSSTRKKKQYEYTPYTQDLSSLQLEDSGPFQEEVRLAVGVFTQKQKKKLDDISNIYSRGSGRVHIKKPKKKENSLSPSKSEHFFKQD